MIVGSRHRAAYSESVTESRHPLDETAHEPEEREPAERQPAEDQPAEDQPEERQPDWWHRDHPTFTALSGFFTGLGFVIVVPGAFAAILSALFDTSTAEELFPFVLLTLGVPIGLLVAPRTRRFGRYMLIGMTTTLIVVVGVAALVLWALVKIEG